MTGKEENEPILREEAESVRIRLKYVLFNKGCSHCHIQPSIREVAALLGIDWSNLHKFINETYGHMGLRRKTYAKLVEWLARVE